jgi:hypothetical protein
MLSGFNTNFRYCGVLFHIQTEDSGRANPHVITHMFHGGNILASVKCDYSDKLDSQDLESLVKTLMETQHRSMLDRLEAGGHDEVILQRLGPDAFKSNDTDTVPPVGSPSQAASRESTDSTDPTAATQLRAAADAAAGEAPAAGAARARSTEGTARAFGDGVVSQRPLDEVVLDYLVENARKRKRSSE